MASLTITRYCTLASVAITGLNMPLTHRRRVMAYQCSQLCSCMFSSEVDNLVDCFIVQLLVVLWCTIYLAVIHFRIMLYISVDYPIVCL